MNWLDSTLKDLQTKKLKAEFFTFLKNKLVDIKNIEFQSVEDDVKKLISTFIDSQIDMISSGVATEKEEVINLFSTDEVKMLKLIANKAMNKTVVNNPMESITPNKPNQPQSSVQPKQDKIQFALANRHLDGKEVSIYAANGTLVKGKVVGLDSPYVIVKTETGHTVPVLLENLQS